MVAFLQYSIPAVVVVAVLSFSVVMRTRRTESFKARNLRPLMLLAACYHFHWKRNVLMLAKVLLCCVIAATSLPVGLCFLSPSFDNCAWLTNAQDDSSSSSNWIPTAGDALSSDSLPMTIVTQYRTYLGAAFVVLFGEALMLIILFNCSMRVNNGWDAIPASEDPTAIDVTVPTKRLALEWHALRVTRIASVVLFVIVLTAGVLSRLVATALVVTTFVDNYPAGPSKMSPVTMIAVVGAWVLFLCVCASCAHRTWCEQPHQHDDHIAHVCATCAGAGRLQMGACPECHGRGLVIQLEHHHWAPPVT